ncbi:ribosome biogenesis GTP-binding protein YihA/YsxC [Rubeoparvulum massiliense]|uniref:ribosome biogenesis GTP-binding protein YihA/YsxC n=1 Tax=Rubeoparvulum massiliense TaxID=1631346 RepID=UPI00065E0EB9|nr:ribosome biogenesis GTP-binding protein YihA/YsxC [Rubeoparvulum massiliense]
MKITDAELIISAVKESQYPGGQLPELAIVGRSNVGKSSFINAMLQRKKLARASAKPGKTRTLNFYRINQRFFFVDLPGYGYAQVSQEEKQKWAQFIEAYLSQREHLIGVIQVVDLRHPPSKDDIVMFDWLQAMEVPTIVVATKADKLPRSKLQQHQKVIRETLEMKKETPLLLFSAETGSGREEAWSIIESFLGEV